jgi:hypothetical protein
VRVRVRVRAAGGGSCVLEGRRGGAYLFFF